jgi:hypothetical protein
MNKPIIYRNEADVKKQVKRLLNKYEWFWWCPPANGFGKIGVSDFNALQNAVFLAIETKFGKNKPTDHQKAYLDSIIAMKGYGFVVSERNIEFLEQFLDAFSRSIELIKKDQKPSPDDGSMMLNAIRALTEDLFA